MTKAEVEAAKEFLKTLKVEVLLSARQTIQQAFQSQQASIASQNTYGNRFNQFLSWSEQQQWWPARGSRRARVKQQSCPSMKSLYGDTSNTPLTERRTIHQEYMLKPQDTPAALQKELDDFYRYLTDPEYPFRVIDPISESSALQYVNDIRLMLGWFCYCCTPPIALEQVRLSHLISVVRQEDLEHLNSKEQVKLWKQHKQTFETWLCSYFRFLREVLHSKSPSTKRNKLGALLALAKFLYTSEVEEDADYQQIPLFKSLNNHLSSVRKDISEWVKNRQSVSDFEKKWPDTAEGETALAVVRTKIVEPLRLECRPRNIRGQFRVGFAIAKSYQDYLKWSLLADIPARRQQEYRTLRIALTCPVKRPESLPPDGLYHPLPPAQVREKHWDGTIKDNYLYKTYVHEKKHYPQGVWVLDIQQYKTRSTHAAQSIVIPNRQLADGSCFYDYLEGYLYGSWLSEGYKNRQVYDWWQPELKGQRGRWVTSGRAEFNPGDACCLPTGVNSPLWSWGYVFVLPILGIKADGPGFGSSFETTSHRFLGKRISPHTMRYIWATWAYQVRLDDAQTRSLAYAMGHKVETLRGMYERCTPEEKRRPIEEAIEELLFKQPPSPELNQKANAQWETLLAQLQKLSPVEREQLMAMLEK
ncbi:hypothetical protein NDI44_24720 [Trichocoleus sp. DQ-A3]|uniref:hypothetical protein n=1 Tax=Cyanophyceae TaxID=3028117 RepID=UPI00168734FC|nr:hypothetical protein [Coleofasciculus sp. FACHB-125]MBD1899468.1 hypothetical protein [Coleofasciculus sp. FACHB-125]